MITALAGNWARLEPLMQGLKRGGLMNQCLEDEDTYRQGRHHVMTAINQILECTIAVEQLSACFRKANLSYSLTLLNIAAYVIPAGAAYFASRQIKALGLSEKANFIQDHLGKISFIVTAIATGALFLLGQQLLAGCTCVYLAVGVLDRYNFFSENTQKRLRQTNFVIANLAGLYFGGHFIRVMCVVNLVVASVQQYFKYLRISEQKKENALRIEPKNRVAEASPVERIQPKISLAELQRLRNDSVCPIIKSHVHKPILPPVDENVRIDGILDAYYQIDWDNHEHVVKTRLEKDKRWLEVGQRNFTPMKYFEKNLISFVESIRDHTILEGKPESYEMLEYYCRYIAQELKNQDEMTQANILIKLGVDGGEYCGTGKFGAAEEVFEDLIGQSNGLPLDLRVLAALRQERMRVWQNIYLMTWQTNPFWQIQGYFTDVYAVHNANLFINLIRAGEKFGIPHQAAQNDQTALINPATHYLAFTMVKWVEEVFWNGRPIPQCYFSFENPNENDRLKSMGLKINIGLAEPSPYDQTAMLNRLHAVIGTAQISRYDIPIWWAHWIERQEELTEEERAQLTDELQSYSPSIGGETLEAEVEAGEEHPKIRNKFLLAMLIEMGVLDKPVEWAVED